MAWVPRPSTADSPSPSRKVMPEGRVNAPAAMEMPSPSKSDGWSVYWNASIWEATRPVPCAKYQFMKPS